MKAVNYAESKVAFHRLQIQSLQGKGDEQLRNKHGQEHHKAHQAWGYHIARLGAIDDHNKAIDRMKYLGITEDGP